VSESEPVLRHVWILDDAGDRDDSMAEYGDRCMGPGCSVCGDSFCMFCKDLDSLVCEGPRSQSDRIEFAQKEIIRLQAFLAKHQVSETPIPPERSQP